ncbi:MAG TPA: hypothetical protein VG982_03075 [Candidatus Paceibacterota bacterium]|nr:hypothetical protein [Candidatus Paceibacterota bacterium]
MSRSYTLRFAQKHLQTWQYIKTGKKTVETRAATTKYLPIQTGDTLIFSCAGKKFEKKIKKVTHVKTIAALIKKYPPGVINPGTTTLKEMETMYYSYPGYKEKIATCGILAFELE